LVGEDKKGRGGTRISVQGGDVLIVTPGERERRYSQKENEGGKEYRIEKPGKEGRKKWV